MDPALQRVQECERLHRLPGTHPRGRQAKHNRKEVGARKGARALSPRRSKLPCTHGGHRTPPGLGHGRGAAEAPPDRGGGLDASPHLLRRALLQHILLHGHGHVRVRVRVWVRIRVRVRVLAPPPACLPGGRSSGQRGDAARRGRAEPGPRRPPHRRLRAARRLRSPSSVGRGAGHERAGPRDAGGRAGSRAFRGYCGEGREKARRERPAGMALSSSLLPSLPR